MAVNNNNKKASCPCRTYILVVGRKVKQFNKKYFGECKAGKEGRERQRVSVQVSRVEIGNMMAREKGLLKFNSAKI